MFHKFYVVISLFGSFIRSKPHLSCPFSCLSIYPSLLRMDSSSVCIWSHFYSRPCLFIYLWADCSLFWCPIVQLSVIFKTLECHLPQIPSLSIPAFFSMAPLAYISLSVHQQADSFFSAFKSTFLFFIAAISLLFKSTDNVVLSILLHPFQWRVQGFSLCLSLSHSGGIWGEP